MPDYREDPALSKAVISAIGAKQLMHDFCRSKGAISQWRKYGIPSSIMRCIRLTYPLKVFEVKKN